MQKHCGYIHDFSQRVDVIKRPGASFLTTKGKVLVTSELLADNPV